MRITKNWTSPSGVILSCHCAKSIEIRETGCVLTVNSWPNFEASMADPRPSWQQEYSLPDTVLGVDPLARAETWLLTEGQPFFGGSRVVDMSSAVLDARKKAKNEYITHARNDADYGVFIFSDHPVRADVASQLRMTSIGLYVLSSNALPPDFNGQWKCADNTYLTIPNVATWLAFHGALRLLQATNHSQSELLKAAIEAVSSTTPPSILDAIVWDSAYVASI